MRLTDIIQRLDYEILVEGQDHEVHSGYASDLLSDVMANCPEGGVWLTIQRHLNVIAVAQLKRIAAIIITNRGRLDDAALERAREEEIYVLSAPENTFEASGKIYALLNNQPA